ncbi:adenylate kinase [bacterium]|nr:adenylate kinase [bacterium]
MKIIFLGAPGSGKGTQSKLVSKKLTIPQLSTGDILREAVKAGTEVGKKAKSFMDAGDLVPDEVIVGIIKDRTAQADCKKGYILDGFPRTLEQANSLQEMYSQNNDSLDKVVYLEINPEKVVERLTGRRVCSNCGAEFHLQFKTPKAEGKCDLCNSDLMHRSDDHEDKIRNRLGNYDAQTAPLIQYYEKEGVMKKVAAEGSIDEITAKIMDVLK